MCLIATYTSSQNVQTFTLILDLNPTVNFVIFILCSQRNFRLLIWLLSSLDTTAKAQEGEQKYSRPRTAWLRANTLSDLPRSPGQSKSISQVQYRGEGTCTLLFEEGGFQSHGAKGLERNVESGPIMHPATWGQLHGHRNPSGLRSSHGIFEPLLFCHDYLDSATNLHIFCVS